MSPHEAELLDNLLYVLLGLCMPIAGWKIPLRTAAGLQIEGAPVGCYLVTHLDFSIFVPLTSKLIALTVHFQGVPFPVHAN